MAGTTALAKKAKKTINKAGDTIKSNPKTSLYVLAGLLGLFSIYKIAGWAKNASDALSGDSIDNNIDTQVNINYSRTSISRTQAKNFASQLLVAMNWRGFVPFPPWYNDGTDTDVLATIFEKINSEDFKMIYKEFGLKDYNGQGSPPKNVGGGIQDSLGISHKRDLVYWLQKELDFFDFSLRTRVGQVVEAAGFIF